MDMVGWYTYPSETYMSSSNWMMIPMEKPPTSNVLETSGTCPSPETMIDNVSLRTIVASSQTQLLAQALRSLQRALII